MSFIDNVKTLVIEDFSDEFKRDGEIIAENYNYFSDQVTNALNGQINYDNLAKSTVTIEVMVGSNGVPIQTTQFSDIERVKGISVLRATNITNTLVFPTGAPFISFTTISNGFYKIQHVTGLPANNKFSLVLELTP